jgi:hypothetical protein
MQGAKVSGTADDDGRRSYSRQCQRNQRTERSRDRGALGYPSA